MTEAKEVFNRSVKISRVLHRLTIEEALATLTVSMLHVFKQVEPDNRKVMMIQLIADMIDELQALERIEKLDGPGIKNADSPWGWGR